MQIKEYLGFINGRMLLKIGDQIIHTDKVISLDFMKNLIYTSSKVYEMSPDVFTVDEVLNIQKHLDGEIELRFTKRVIGKEENSL